MRLLRKFKRKIRIIVGERIVARLRSKLFRQTYVQNAEFFDANRVGDLISRLGSDTIIVGKSITQNLSDGLRSFVSGAAGFSLMAWVSVKLTGVLALMFPPVAIGAQVLRAEGCRDPLCPQGNPHRLAATWGRAGRRPTGWY